MGTSWGGLTFRQRLDAVHDHARFFSTIRPEWLPVPVPACPDWTVEDVVRHVAGWASAGLLLCDPAAPDDVAPTTVMNEHMAIARALPVDQLPNVVLMYDEVISGRMEDSPALAHLGHATVGEQAWHAAADWGIHRHDVEVALGIEPTLSAARAADSILWLSEYLLPVLSHFKRLPTLPTIRLVADDVGLDHQHGVGSPAVTISGSAHDVLLHLWRRPHGPVTLHGDPVAAHTYTGVAI